MDTEIDWQRELDSSFGTGEDVDVAHYVASGQRAVRRRRISAVVAGLGAAAVVAGVAWTAAPGGAPRTGDLPVATQRPTSPTTSPTETPTAAPSTAPARVELWRAGEPPARATPAGLEIRDGAVVHERRDDIYPDKATESAALDISRDGERWWLVLEWDDGGSGMSSTKPDDGPFDSFDAFVRAEVASGGMTSQPAGDPQYEYADLVNWWGGDLELRPGATVVRRVDDPIDSKDWKDSVGLVVRADGELTWLVIMLARDGAAATSEQAAESGWPTFDLWLAEQVALQTGQPGLRLVEIDLDGTVTPALPGVEVLDQQTDPDLADYGTDAAVASAVALVSWRGERWFVLAMVLPDQESATTFAAAKADGAETIDDFVAFAAARADEGGLR